MKLRLIGHAQTRAFRCIWMLEELGLPYEHLQAMPASKAVLEQNPSGKVPALVVSQDSSAGFPSSYVVTESAVINTFLGDRFPDSRLVPRHLSHERMQYDQLVMAIMTELDASALWIYHKHVTLGKFFGYVPETEEVSKNQFAKLNDVISIQLKKSNGPFLLGAQFTAADILYGHCLDWAKANGWADIIQSETIASYMEAYRKRPAYNRARAFRKDKTEGVIQRIPNEDPNLKSSL